MKTFCSKNGVEYELFDNVAGPVPYGVIEISKTSAPERIVGDKK